jgi:hypothetical protein
MDLFSFTSIVVILIIVVGSYLVFTDSVQGRAKMILIAFVAIFGIMLLSSLSLFKSYYELIDSPVPGNQEYIISSNKLGSVTQSFSISTWIYINDWNTNFGTSKNIVTYDRGGGTGKEFTINLDTNLNDLSINIPVKTSESSYGTETINVKNISIQKWVNIVVCVGENSVDTYINGKIVTTHTNTNVTATPTTQKDLIFAKGGTGFNGSISGARFYNKFLTPQECWSIYTDGFSNSLLGSFMNRYNASIVFYKDRQKTNEINFM